MQDVEKVGTLIFWESKLDLDTSLKQLDLEWIPKSQVVMESYPEGASRKYVALLPETSGDANSLAEWNGKTMADTNGLEVIILEEPIKRSTYSAFFANLPPSLSNSFGMYTEETADFNRFLNLARTKTDSLLTTSRYSYSLSAGYNSDSLWFNVLPTLEGGYTMTPRDLKLNELMRLQDAIRLLDGDAPEIIEAKAKLTEYYGTLAAQLGL